ncbi:hypothetical protein WEU38_17660 [Cyanobacterium aponinum AL20118]|uniref:Gas vesicle protein n=2 Tax=Cyanobacterium aponinum TaxID=379064 RepID=K9ZA21_CYAAP|nr:hypothetical protein [Cyanobacterium aponinum]AFZ55440.1 hypothetical protein Cyan10605_3398 [Cyanobacterium aponinum PCC 10605]WPF88611.1 hypothetical protein SAY89_17750 [Cyanobacterium aponinum AL20115]
MSNKDNFGSGFIIGTIVGGLVGGVVGSLVASKSQQSKDSDNSNQKKTSYSSLEDEFAMENARLSLEEKINQLNHAIDEVKFGLMSKQEKEKEEN